VSTPILVDTDILIDFKHYPMFDAIEPAYRK